MSSSQINPKSQNLLEIYTINGNSKDFSDLKMTPPNSNETLETKDIDTELVGSEPKLAEFEETPKIQSKFIEEHDKSIEGIYHISTKPVDGVCCACNRDIDWDQYICGEF
jgi:hypothetical protein